MITGPSGVGKGTLIRSLVQQVPELEVSVSATTRPPRPGEVDGVDYHFLSDAEFDRRLAAGEFIEHASYSGNRYGTLRAEVCHPDLRPGTADQYRCARGAGLLASSLSRSSESAWRETLVGYS